MRFRGAKFAWQRLRVACRNKGRFCFSGGQSQLFGMHVHGLDLEAVWKRGLWPSRVGVFPGTRSPGPAVVPAPGLPGRWPWIPVWASSSSSSVECRHIRVSYHHVVPGPVRPPAWTSRPNTGPTAHGRPRRVIPGRIPPAPRSLIPQPHHLGGASYPGRNESDIV